MIKKLFALLLAFIIVLPSLGAFAFEDTDGTGFEQAVNTLEALGIVEGYEDKNFHPDDSLTRAQFAAMVVRLTDTSVYRMPESQVFSDVDKKHWAYEFVNAGYAIGYFSGYGDGSFAPDEKITVAQAVKTLVTMLGYANVAEAYGGYPTGYIKVANSEKLLTGISGSDSQAINRGDVALLIYNCLDKPMLVQTSFGGETEKFEPDSSHTILTEGLDCEIYEGSIIANKVTGIFGNEALGQDKILFEDEEEGNLKFAVGKSGVEGYLGYDLVIYVKEDAKTGEETVIHFEIKEENKEIMVSPEDIDSSTNLRTFSYWEDDKLKSYTLDYDVQVIMNFAVNPFFTLEDITPKSGSVILLDNDGDNRIDIVNVKKYSHYVVSMVDATSLEIYDEYGKAPIRLAEKGKTTDYDIIRKGSSAKFKNIAVGSVLSVLSSVDGSYHEINIITTPVRGKVTAFDGTAYTIGEASYERSVDLPESEVINLGDEGTFYLDIENRIIKVEKGASSDGAYGYLMAAKTGSGIDTTLQLKILNNKSEVVALQVDSKVKFDGEPVSFDALLDKLGGEASIKMQLIKYITNSEGKITSINLPEISFTKADRLYRTSTGMFGYSGTEGGFFINAEETTVFRVPNGGGNEEEYSTIGNGSLGNRVSYSVEGYDLDGLTVGCAVVYVASGNASFTVDANANFCIIKEIRKSIDEDGIANTKLVFMEEGKQKEIIVSSNANLLQVNLRERVNSDYVYTPISVTDLKPGDVFHYTIDALDNANAIGRIFPQEPDSSIDKQPEFCVSRGVSLEKAFGRPKLVSDGGLLLTAGGTDYLYSIKKPSGTIYAYYAKSEQLKTATSAEILDMESAGEAAPYVFIKAHTGIVGDIILFYPNK